MPKAAAKTRPSQDLRGQTVTIRLRDRHCEALIRHHLNKQIPSDEIYLQDMLEMLWWEYWLWGNVGKKRGA
jgi:hypothetical protein